MKFNKTTKLGKRALSLVLAVGMLLSVASVATATEETLPEPVPAVEEAAPVEEPQAEAPVEEQPAEAPQPEAPAEEPQAEAPVEEQPVEAPQPEAPVEEPQAEVAAEPTPAPAEEPQTLAEEQPEAVAEPQAEPAQEVDGNAEIGTFAADAPTMVAVGEKLDTITLGDLTNGDYTVTITDNTGKEVAGTTVLENEDQVVYIQMDYKVSDSVMPNIGPDTDIVYTFPKEIQLNALGETEIKNGNQTLGRYSISHNDETDRWELHLKYDSTVTSASQASGTFRFDCRLKFENVSSTEEKTIDFGGKSNTIQFEVNYTNITGQKTYQINDDGTVTFTITLHPENDVTGVTLTDTLGSDFTFVADSFTLDGATVPATINGQVASLALGNLTAGDHTLTYKANIKENETGEAAKNTAEWAWGGRKNSADTTVDWNANLQAITDTITAHKTLNGDTLKNGQFTFELSNSNIDGGGYWYFGNNHPTTTNDKDGNVSFTVKFTGPGSYDYYLKETNANKPGMAYDSTIYRIHYEVASVNGQLKITSRTLYRTKDSDKANDEEVNAIVFVNSYSRTELDLAGTKTLLGKKISDKNEFQFTITGDDAESKAVLGNGGTKTVGLKGKGDNTAAINYPKLAFEKAGTYNFTIAETNTGKDGVKYDGTQYKLSVTVTTDANGALQTSCTVKKLDADGKEISDASIDALDFNNVYTKTGGDDGDSSFTGTKKLNGGDPGKAKFNFTAQEATLTNGKLVGSGEPITVQNDGSEIVFAGTSFDKAGTYYYIVNEAESDDYARDDTTYYVKVVVEENADGTHTVDSVNLVDADGTNERDISGLVFNNYNVTLNPINVKKELSGRNMTAGEFQFVLYRAKDGDLNANYNSTEKWTRNFDANGNQVNDNSNNNNYTSQIPLTISAPGKYYYRVEEVNTKVTGITYDDTKYYFCVEAEKATDGNGITITAVYAVDANGNQVSDNRVTYNADAKTIDLSSFVFRNTYSSDDEAPSMTIAKKDATPLGQVDGTVNWESTLTISGLTDAQLKAQATATKNSERPISSLTLNDEVPDVADKWISGQNIKLVTSLQPDSFTITAPDGAQALVKGTDYTVTVTGNKFKVEFKDSGLAKLVNGAYTIKYTTKTVTDNADYSLGDFMSELQNKATITNTIKLSWKSKEKKQDGQQANDDHTFASLLKKEQGVYDAATGTVTWLIKVNPLAGWGQNDTDLGEASFTVVDTLSEGLAYVDGSAFVYTAQYGGPNSAADYDNFKDNTESKALSTDVSTDGKTLTWSDIQPGGNKTAFIFYRTKVTYEAFVDGTADSTTLKNSAELKDNGGTTVGKSENTVTVEKQILDKSAILLDGTGKPIQNPTAESSANMLQYTIDVNKTRINLNDGSALTLTDTLSDAGRLLTDTLTVYRVEEDGSKTALTLGRDYTVSLNGNVMTLTLPDAQYLQVCYKVEPTGAYGAAATVTNDAKLSGKITAEKTDTRSFIHVTASATITYENAVITLNKISASGVQPLQGAEFKLELLDAATGNVSEEADAITGITDENGSYSFGNGTAQTLRFNNIYRLTETKAPAGYKLNPEPVYILIPSDDTNRAESEAVLKQAKAWLNGATVKVGSNHTITYTATNELASADIQPLFKKTVNGLVPEANAFSFELMDESGTVLQTKQNDAYGLIKFGTISYTKNDLGEETSKEITYTVKEVIPDDDAKVAGMTYDDTVYTLHVTLTWNEAANALQVSATMQAGDGEAAEIETEPTEPLATFNNTTAAAPTEVEFKAGKIYYGATTGKTFRLELYKADDFYTQGDLIESKEVTPANNGTQSDVTFTAQEFTEPGTYYYLIRENQEVGSGNGMAMDASVYYVKVEVTAGDDNTLTAATTYTWTYEDNTEELAEGEYPVFYNNEITMLSMNFAFVTVSGQKILKTGPETNAPTPAGKFRFNLMDGDTVVASATNNADGSFTMFVSKPMGETKTYTLVEANAGQTIGGITYDNTQYTVTIAADGTVTYREGIPTFTNTAYTNVEVTKVWSGDEGHEDERPAVTFHLWNGNTEVTSQALSGDKVTFENLPTIDTDGNPITYTVTETMSGDTAQYAPAIVADENGSFTVTNTYRGGAASNVFFTPQVKKSLVSAAGESLQLTAGQFSFTMTAADNSFNAQSESYTATNDAEGNVVFPALPYQEAGTYYYTIKENAGTDPYTSYDATEIRLTVTVTEGEDGTLTAEGAYTYGNAATAEPTFTNYYNELLIKLRKTSRDNNEGLYNAVYGLYLLSDGQPALVETATSDADGYMLFKRVVPGQRYYFKEISAPEGHTVEKYPSDVFTVVAKGGGGFEMVYESSTSTHGQPMPVALQSADGTTETVVGTNVLEARGVSDAPTTLNVNKLSADTREVLAGATLQIIEESTGTVMAEWVTDSTTKSFVRTFGSEDKKLNVDTVYILREVSAPDGYAIAADTRFQIVGTNVGTIQILSGSDAEMTNNTTLNLYDQRAAKVVVKEDRKEIVEHKEVYEDDTQPTADVKSNSNNTTVQRVVRVLHGSPQTGDAAPIALVAMLLVAGVLFIVYLQERKKAHRKQ